MAVTIFFNDVERTTNVRRQSLKTESILTNEVDTCSLTVLYYGSSKNFKPLVGDEVEVWEKVGTVARFGISKFGIATFGKGTKLFAGIVVKVEEKMLGAVLIAYDVNCVDYTRLADKKLVAKAYTSQTVNSIIADIASTYLSGFTVVNVDCSIAIDYVAFNYEPFSKCLQRLAELVGYDWYIDYDKDIHFFSKEINLSPFNLTDTNNKYVFKSLKIARNISQIKNVVYVRGGEYLASSFTENQFGDGSKRDFKLAYKYTDLSVVVNGTPYTVGIDYLHDADDYDCLFNFNEKVVKFRDNNKPTDGWTVDISGTPYVPVIVQARNQDSINDNGEYQFRIIDKSIKTKAGARERGSGELATYASSLSEGEFQTYTRGLRSGQLININSAIRSLDEDFLINKVVARMRTEDAMVYDVSIVSTKTMGIINFLQKLLISDDRKLTINENEVVDKLWTGEESFTLQKKSYLWNTPITRPWYVANANTPVGSVGFCEAS